MANKDVLKYGNDYVPTINDNPVSNFEEYETYSRKTIDKKIREIQISGGYDWTGRKIIFEGESITKNETTAYPEYVGQQTGCVVRKVAQSGFCLYGNYVGKPHDFRIRISNYDADADAIIILGDCNSTLFITSSSGCGDIDSNTPETWFGRWNLALEAIKKSFPTVPIFLVAEFGQSLKNQKTTYLVSTYFQQLARKWCCIYIDLPTESPLDLKYAPTVWGLTDTDSIHASHEAMPLYADVIIRHLRQIPPFEFTGTDTINISESNVPVAVGATVELSVTKTGDLSTQWVSDNTDVACVMGGVVYGMAVGTATITATTRNGNTATCTVTVTES